MSCILLVHCDGSIRYCTDTIPDTENNWIPTFESIPIGSVLEPVHFRTPRSAWKVWKQYSKHDPEAAKWLRPMVIDLSPSMSAS